MTESGQARQSVGLQKVMAGDGIPTSMMRRMSTRSKRASTMKSGDVPPPEVDEEAPTPAEAAEESAFEMETNDAQKL